MTSYLHVYPSCWWRYFLWFLYKNAWHVISRFLISPILRRGRVEYWPWSFDDEIISEVVQEYFLWWFCLLPYCFDNCVGVLVICVLVFTVFFYCSVYVYLFLFVTSVRTSENSTAVNNNNKHESQWPLDSYKNYTNNILCEVVIAGITGGHFETWAYKFSVFSLNTEEADSSKFPIQQTTRRRNLEDSDNK